jgi:hypothetical protein
MTPPPIGATVRLRFDHALNNPIFVRPGVPLYDHPKPFVVEGITVFDPHDGFEPVVRVILKDVPGEWMASRFVEVRP